MVGTAEMICFSIFLLPKLVDLPCVIESHKTVDNKSFYKTADICQVSMKNINNKQSN